MHGHLAAHLDPLGTPPIGDPALDPGWPARAHARGPWRRSRPRCSASRCPGGRWPSRSPISRPPTAGPWPTRSSTSPPTRSGSGCGRRSRAAPTASRWPRAEQRRLLRRLTEVEALEKFLHKAYLGQKRFSIEGVDMLVPMLDLTIERAAELGRARRGDRHGASRPAQRAGPHRGAALRDDLRRVRGRPAGGGRAAHARGRHRRREVPPRRRGRLRHHGRQGDHRLALAQPEPPRVREPGGGRAGPRQADPAPGTGGAPRSLGRASGHHPRRRGVRRPGRRGGDPQPRLAQGISHRRDAPRHHQQPGRLHHRHGGRAQHPLRLRPGQGIRHSDHPRQRRRRRGLPQRGAAGDGVPRPVPPGRGDRSGRLPPARPQRGRRAGLHPAADVRADQEPPDRAGRVREAAGGRRRAHPGRSRPGGERGLPAPGGHPAVLQGQHGQEHHQGACAPAERRGAGVRHRAVAGVPHRAQRAAPHLARGIHRPSQAQAGSSSAGAPRWGPRAESTGRTPKRWRSPRC